MRDARIKALLEYIEARGPMIYVCDDRFPPSAKTALRPLQGAGSGPGVRKEGGAQ